MVHFLLINPIVCIFCWRVLNNFERKVFIQIVDESNKLVPISRLSNS
jgi:hypothetical protein